VRIIETRELQLAEQAVADLVALNAMGVLWFLPTAVDQERLTDDQKQAALARRRADYRPAGSGKTVAAALAAAGRARLARAARLCSDARRVTGERWVITEISDDHEQLDAVHARAREDEHVVLVVPTPGGGGEGIARDILRALGKRFDLPRTPREPQALLRLARLWLAAHRITTLIIRHAGLVTPGTWREILRIAPANTNTWLWAELPITLAQRRVCRRFGVNSGSFARLAASLAFGPAPPHPMAQLAEQVPAPAAPDADYVLFAVASQD
jgi:hypothetical protein